MIRHNGEPSHLFYDDYKPVEMFADGKKVTGWKEEEHTGKDIVIEETYNDNLNLLCKGEHTQNTLNGYNQFDIDSVILGKWTSSGGTVSNAIYGAHSAEFNVEGVQIISVKLAFKPYSVGFVYLDENGKFLRRMLWAQNLQPPYEWHDTVHGHAKTAYLIISTATETGQLTVPITKEWIESQHILVEKGNTFHDYEPYCGGIPSPNPQYPQEIVPTKAEATISANLHPMDMIPNNSTLSEDGWIIKNANSYDNIFNMNQMKRMHIKEDSDYTIVIETYDEQTQQQRFRMVHDNRFCTEYFYEDGYKQINYSKCLRRGFNFFHVHTKSSFEQGQLGFMWIQSANIFPSFKYRLFVYEGWHDIERYVPYRTPQQLITDYELYGSDGIYDTLEPCVMVDGEWKCRVTRRWHIVDFTGLTFQTWGVKAETTGFYRYMDSRNHPKGIVDARGNENTRSTHFKRNDRIWGGNGVGCYTFGPNPYMAVSIPNSILSDVSSNTAAVQSFADFLWEQSNQGKPVKYLYVVENPIIELYDPIPLYTNPYCTIINGNTEMVATAKTTDYTTSELMAMLNEMYLEVEKELS